jgi:prepilin-type processing-associated H-X9-DG protein
VRNRVPRLPICYDPCARISQDPQAVRPFGSFWLGPSSGRVCCSNDKSQTGGQQDGDRFIRLRSVSSLGFILVELLAQVGGGVDTRHGATAVPTVPCTYCGETSYCRSGSGNVVWVDGHVTARTSREINDVVRWRHLWDPLQGVGGW